MTTFPIPPRNQGEWYGFAQRLVQQLNNLTTRIGENVQVDSGEMNGNDSTYISLPGGGSVVVPTRNRQARMGEVNIEDGAITTNKLVANAVDANKIDVTQLSAINADLGNITAGSLSSITVTGAVVTGSLIRTSASGGRVELNDSTNTLRSYNTSGSVQIEIGPTTNVPDNVVINTTNAIKVGSTVVNGDLTVDDDLFVTKNITANSYKISGSTILRESGGGGALYIQNDLGTGGVYIRDKSGDNIALFEDSGTNNNPVRMKFAGGLKRIFVDSNGFVKAV